MTPIRRALGEVAAQRAQRRRGHHRVADPVRQKDRDIHFQTMKSNADATPLAYAAPNLCNSRVVE